MDQKNCKDCGTDVNVKKSGDLWRHKNPDGFWCDSTSGTNHVVEAAPMVFDATTTVDKKPGLQIDVAGADAPKKSTRSQTKKKTNVFIFTMEVSANCPYLGDRSWEGGNKMVAAKKAQDAGKRVVGEPQRVKSEVVGRKQILTYEVPVE
jgi:hypothetical protein